MIKIRFKEIRLYPTLFSLDVYIVDEPYKRNSYSESSRKLLSKFFTKRYGGSYSYYYEDNYGINQVFDIRSTKNSELKGDKRIVMVINPLLKILVHEIVHIFHHVAELSGVETGEQSQEWQACFCEYLFEQIRHFNKIPKLTITE